MRRILVVSPSWIGDTILSQPLLALLQARHPDAAIDCLGPTRVLPLVRRMPQVRQAIESPFAHGELALTARRRLGRSLAAGGYDQAIVLPNTFKSALPPFFAGIPLRTGYVGELRYGLLNDARRPDRRAHPQIAQRYAALGLAPGEPLPGTLPRPALRVDEAARRATLEKFGLAADRPVAVLCPGAEYGPAKRWPARYFAALADVLTARGLAVWLIGAAGDREAGAAIAGRAASSRNLCGETTLDEAIDLVSFAAVVVSNDSGLMHVAAALGRPLVALFGSSSPSYTPPLSDEARILTLGLPCSPCFRRECPLGHFNCMMQLEPSRVLAAVDFDRMPGARAAAPGSSASFPDMPPRR